MQSKISRKEFNLSDSDQEALEEVYDESENVKVRERANALLLMNQGFSVKEVAQIIRRPISTIYTWISRWEERGLEGIEDRKSPGRPPIWTDSDQDTVLDVVRNEPRRINAALPEIGRKTGNVLTFAGSRFKDPAPATYHSVLPDSVSYRQQANDVNRMLANSVPSNRISTPQNGCCRSEPGFCGGFSRFCLLRDTAGHTLAGAGV